MLAFLFFSKNRLKTNSFSKNLKKPDVILFFALYIKLSSEEKNTCVKLPECKWYRQKQD